ncbi:tetrapeptide repeat protein [Citrifermentans bemidjiense Bem]|uniref:Tetrapeptide repeat protein n=1 Tax=Citrifermentans bemidjiense (strain ATCC BAA-1014 / DSM 16622 / JCM 12645 / Bem) TaxID=404380 RepID=B5EHS4_CITBB|nr:tetrapeptide repeat protein [Citrifermentans bemidjiense Bem]
MTLIHFNKYGARGKCPSFLLAQLCCALLLLLLMGNEAFAAYQADLMVRLANEGDSSYVGAGIFETTAVIQSKSQGSYSGYPAQFRVQVKNAGDQADSFVLTGPASGSGFTVSYRDQGGVERAAQFAAGGYRTEALAPGASAVLLVQVTLDRFTQGASYRVPITAVSVADPAGADQVKTETVACGLTAAVTVSAPPDGSGAPGSLVIYPYTVTNVGNAVNSFALSLESGSPWPWTLYADDGAGGGIAGDGVRQTGETNRCVSTGPLAPGASHRFFLAIAIPESGSDGARADARLAVTGEGASGNDQVTTTALAAVLTLSDGVRNLSKGGIFASTVDAVPGDLLQYRMAITNSGSAPATAVRVESPLPAGLKLKPDSLVVALATDGEAAPCPAAHCGRAWGTAGSIVALLGEGASETIGGSLPPGKTVYLFFKAQVE